MEDAYISDLSPLSNYGGAPNLYLSRGPDPAEAEITRTLLRFDLSLIPSGVRVLDARLALWQWDAGGAGTVLLEAFAVRGTWDENSVTWTGQPEVSTESHARTSSNLVAAAWMAWDVTALVQEWLDGGLENQGIELRGPESSGLWARRFVSSEAGHDCPTLLLQVQGSGPIDIPTPTPTATPTPTPTPGGTCPGQDAGDSFALASLLHPNAAPVLEYICPSGDRDYWRFDLEAGQEVDIALYALPTDYDLALLSPSGSSLATSERWGADRSEQIRQTVYEPGEYRVIVWGKSAADWNRSHPYTLEVKSRFPCYKPDAAGNTFAEATVAQASLPEANVQHLQRDALCPQGDIDFYSFIVPGGQTVIMDIGLRDLPADYDLRLYNPQGGMVRQSTRTDLQDEGIYYAAIDVPGAWRVAVQAKSPDVYHAGDYTLEVKLSGLADLKVEGIEITQAIQDMGNTVPLVADKNTVIRVYVGADNTSGSNSAGAVRVALSAYEVDYYTGRHTLIPPVLTQEGGIASTLPVANGKRLDYGQSVNFTPPGSWMGREYLHVHAEVNPGPTLPEADYGNNVAEARASIMRTDPINVVFMAITAGGRTPSLVGSADLNDMVAWLRNIFPNSRVRTRIHPATLLADYDYTLPGEGCGAGWRSLLEDMMEVFWLEMRGDPLLPVTYYYGLLPPKLPSNNTAACGKTPGHVAAGFLDAGQGDKVVHELTHNFGHFHAPSDWDGYGNPMPWCTDPGTADDNYPQYVDPSGVNYHRSSIGEVGLDLTASMPMPQDPATTFDYMAYCGPQRWVSPYRYKGLLNQMPGVRPNLPALLAGAEADPGAGMQTAYLFVAGAVEDGHIILNRPMWNMLAPAPNETPPESGPYRIELQDAGGAVLVTRFFDPQDSFHGTSPDDGTFFEALPLAAGTERVVFLRGDTAIHTITRSPSVPKVRLLSPKGGDSWDKGVQTIAWTASDSDGGVLTSHLRYSPDGGETWHALAANLKGTAFEVDVSGLPGGTNALVQVLISDGFNTTADSNDTPFQVSRRPPAVLLMQPPDDLRLRPGQALFMQGAASDPEDGPLAGSVLVWTSDIDGELGSGEALAVNGLSSGHHRLTLAATDSDGVEGEANVDVYVGESLAMPLIRRQSP